MMYSVSDVVMTLLIGGGVTACAFFVITIWLKKETDSWRAVNASAILFGLIAFFYLAYGLGVKANG